MYFIFVKIHIKCYYIIYGKIYGQYCSPREYTIMRFFYTAFRKLAFWYRISFNFIAVAADCSQAKDMINKHCKPF